MPATPIAVLLLFALTVHTLTTFEIPQSPEWAWTEPHGRLDGTELSPAHISALGQMLERAEETVPRTASSFGLHFDSGPQLSFGRQEIGILASSDLFMHYSGPQPLQVQDAHFSDQQFEIELIQLEESLGLPFTLHPGQTAKITIQLFPRWIGATITQLVLDTSAGKAFYVVKASIQSSAYQIHELVITSQESAVLEIFNPLEVPLFIVDVFKHPSSSPLKVPSFWQFSKCRAIAAGSTMKLTVVGTNVAAEVLGMVVIMTNGQKFAVPVTVKPPKFQINTKNVNFGIVIASTVRHLVHLHVSNYCNSPITVVNITASHHSVQISTYRDEIQPFMVDVLLADLAFQPTENTVLLGFITIVTNVSTHTVPFQAFANLAIVNYDTRVLTFSGSELASRSLSLNIVNITRPIRLLSAVSQSPAVSLSDLSPNQTLSWYSKEILRVEINRSVPLPSYSFIALETALGVIGLPVWFQKEHFTCMLVFTRKTCEWDDAFSLGSQTLNQVRLFKVQLCNKGLAPLQIHTDWRGNGHPVRAVFYQISETTELGTTEGQPARFHFLKSAECAVVEFAVTITDNEPEVTAEISLNEHIFTFHLTWEPIQGELLVLPHSINLEQAFLGKAIAFPLVIEHTFPRNLSLLHAFTNITGVQMRKFENFVNPNKPTRAWDIYYPMLANFRRPANYSQVVTPFEVKDWGIRQAENSQVVEGVLSLQADIIEIVHIPFKSTFQPPHLTADSVDFGFVGVGDVRSRYLKVTNPGDDWMHVQLLLFKGKLSFQLFNIGYLMDAISAAEMPSTPKPGSQGFYLSAQAREIVKIRSRESAILGPILFAPGDVGAFQLSLYLRNNLTVFEAVDLRGSSSAVLLHSLDEKSEDFHFNLVEEGKELETTWNSKVARKFTLINSGNHATFVKGIKLEGQFCALGEFEVLNCEEEQLLQPNATLEVFVRLRPSFSLTRVSIELWVLTLNGEFVLPISVSYPNDGQMRHQSSAFEAVSVLSVLLMSALGVLCSFLRDSLPSRCKQFPLLPKLSMVAPEFRPLLPEPRKARKHRKKKQEVLTVDPSAPVPDQVDTAVSSKEEAAPQLAWEKAEDRTLELGEARESDDQVEDLESSEDGFLDDYRETSGLFMGFRTYAEEDC